jgi:hypothetical protein
LRLAHDPEKWIPVFGKDHAQAKRWSAMPIRRKGIRLQRMIPKSGHRFSEKIMRKQDARHDPEKWEPVFGQDHAPEKR